MEISVVYRIATVFHDLHPITGKVHPKWRWLVIWRMINTVIFRESWCFINRPHISEEQTPPLMNLVSPLAKITFYTTRRGFSWRIQYSAIYIKMPTVITAAYSSFCNDAVL
jgi:hypothetical protein